MQLEQGRRWQGRVAKGEDLWDWLAEFGRRHEIQAGTIRGIGAARRAAWAVYDQEVEKYRETRLDEPLEIVSLTGNFSILDGEPFPHVHIVFSGHDGSCLGGHLVQGTEVFLVEYEIVEHTGGQLVRSMDDELGLPVWQPDEDL